MPKRVSLPSMLPPACMALAAWSTPKGGSNGLPACSAGMMAITASTNITVIAASTAQPWRRSPTIAAESEAQCRRDQEDREHLHEVGQRRRVFIRVRRVGIEEPAAVGAQHLDGLLRGDRAHGQFLRRAGHVLHAPAHPCRLSWAGRRHRLGLLIGGGLQRGDVLVRVEVLDHALADQEHREYQRQRQQQPDGDAGDVDPEIADRRPSTRAAKPRASANATAMPVAADRKFCTARPSICVR